MLHGRERERDHVAGLLRGARSGRSFALLLEGAAGIGKTSLLDDAVAAAEGMLVLRAQGYEAESDLPFAGLSDLLTPVIDARHALPEAQRRALGGALALEAAPPRDRFSVPVAVLGLLGLLAEEQPLLVVVDDAHWLDDASRDAILFIARRLDTEGIGLLVAARDSEPVRLDAAGLPRLELGGLDRAAALALLREAPPLAPDVERALADAAAGNPLALVELPRGLSDDQRAGRAPLAPLPAAGGDVHAAFARRLEALPPDARRALCLAAAATGAPADQLPAALEHAGLDEGALAPALDAGLVTRDGARIAFRHPLLATAAYHAAPSAERRAVHAALAAVARDPARRGWHLAAAAIGADEAVAAALDVAAQDARARGAHAEAARAAVRAGELTPSDDARASRLLVAARDVALTGDGPRAAELAADAERLARDPVVTAGARRLRAHVLMRGGDPAAAQRLLEKLAAGAAARGEPAAAAEMLLEASIAHMISGDMDGLLEQSARARELAAGVSDELTLLATLVGGEALLALGRSAEGDRLVAVAEPLLFGADPLSDVAEVVGMGAMTSMWIERFDRAERTLAHLIDGARAAGAAARLAYPLSVRAQLNWRRGRWAAAYADAEEAVRLGRETGQQGLLAVALPYLARCEASIGHLEEARAHGVEGAALVAGGDGGATELHSLAALGFVELTAGRADAALAWLDRAAAFTAAADHREPALAMYAADHVEALVRAGRRDDAERELALLAERAEATGGAWAHAAAARGRTMLAEDDAFEAAAAAALRWHDRVDMPFERARTELALGERLRRARRRAEARAPLTAALATFERLGAEPWAERARGELRATGGRAQRPEAATPVEQLTPHELQVALLVAQGLTNREVGAALFLSPKTIEHHLSAIYRKLDVRARAQLASLLAGEVPAAA